MTKFQFLVPVDGSDNSRAAAKHAVELAGKYGAEISTMYVADIRKYLPHDEILEIIESAGEEYIGQVRELALSKGITVKSANVLTGSPVDKIIIEAKELDASLIIMAASGRSHTKATPIGVVANRVLRSCDTNILLVRDTETAEHYKKIMILTDGSKDAEYAAQFGMSIAKRYNSEVYACTIVDTQQKIIQRHVTTYEDVGHGKILGETMGYSEAIINRLRQRLMDDAAKLAENVRKIADEKGIKAEIIVKDGKPATEILKIARDKQIDLLVLGSTGKGSISKMMVGSISEKVASTAKCSVLVVKSSRIERVVPE